MKTLKKLKYEGQGPSHTFFAIFVIEFDGEDFFLVELKVYCGDMGMNDSQTSPFMVSGSYG